MPELDPKAASNIAHWLNGQYDEKTKIAIRQLVKENPKEATDAFYSSLSFGTGGMRGLMGIGTNRINEYTIRAATQGLANYVNKQPPTPDGHSAFIGFDSRHHSETFAHEAAKVLAANGIRVFLCKDFRPTPLVSFGCRLKKCTTAIMITASHNPPEYNGYKVYWSDGGQVLPPHDIEIMEEVEKITDPTMVKSVHTLENPLITMVSEDIDAPYLDEGCKLQNYPESNKLYGKDLKIIYTSLHGTGITLTPKMLLGWGFSNVSFVKKQIIPDGNFPEAKSPNPEDPSALALGIKELKITCGDILIANDPDADRMGVVVMHHGEAVMVNGNQIACLCLEHLCAALTTQNHMPQKAAFIKTIVTTELFMAICNHYKKKCFNVLTGFKYIAEMILEWEKDPKGCQFIFGAEESYGYLYGTLTRDKDAVIASALIAEIALQAKRQGKTLIDLLHDLYQRHGVFVEDVLSIVFEDTKEGKEKMTQGMQDLRKNVPNEINGIAVIAFEDYLSSIRTDFLHNRKEKILLPISNVILFLLADGSKLVVRPSGTEPKIKLYCGVVNPIVESIDETLKHSKAHAEQLLGSLKSLFI